MTRLLFRAAIPTLALFMLPLVAGAAMTPGLYEYSIRMNMPGGPANMPAQTSQRCIGAKDIEGNKAFEMPPSRDSDCQVKDMVQSGGNFSYRVSCTRPQKIDGTVKGSHTPTSVAMEMVMSMPDMPGPLTQNITARRIGDCKQ